MKNTGLQLYQQSYEGKKVNGTRIIKNDNFTPKEAQRILSSHKIAEKYNEQEVFYKKAVNKNFAMFTEKHLYCCLFFNKNKGLQLCNFIKKRLHKGVFL